MTISAEVDERTLREIHLVAFEARRTGGRRLVRDDRLQQGQRRVLRRAARPDRRRAPRRVGLRRARHVGLVRDALDGAGGAGRPRPRDARAVGLARAHPGRRRPGRRRRRVGGRRPGAPRAAAHGPGGDPRAGRRRPTNGRRTTRRDGRWPAGWRRRGPSCWSTTGCSRWTRRASASVAVIGPNAGQLAMGGGSSEVTPHRRRRVADALAERLPGASISYEVGCRIDRGLPPIDLRLLADCGRREPSRRVLRQPGARPAHRWRRRWRTRRASCGSVPRSRARRRRSARSGSPPRSRPTCRVRGSSGSRAPGGPCCASTATSSSTTPSPPGAPASTAPAASRST